MKVKINSTKIKIFSAISLTFFVFLSALGIHFAFKIKSDYDIDQFLPKNHHLLQWDQESKKLFHISEAAAHILLLSLPEGESKQWHDRVYIDGLVELTSRIEGLEGVQSVLSLGNIQYAQEQDNQLIVGTLKDLRDEGFQIDKLLDDPLYTPNLISKDGRHTAVFVLPYVQPQEKHKKLMNELALHANEIFPEASVKVGGP